MTGLVVPNQLSQGVRRGPAATTPQGNLKETSIEPIPLLRRLTTKGGTSRRGIMRIIARTLATASLVVLTAFVAAQAQAANVDAASAIDAVTVYPDGASVTRIITLDLPAGENSAVIRDFPLTLDKSSLRVEGEAGAKLTIGAIDARPPRAAPPVNLSEIDKRIEALKDEHANLQGAIAAAGARRKFAERFAEARRRELARRARHVRSPNGELPLPRSRRKSRSRMLPSATRNASSATLTVRSRDWNPIGRSSRRASSRSGSISPPPPRPKRRCG
ncbi:MAG: hypothetical protein JWQ17_1648 [Tardiphaga sp.]|nr:hypothetical protein [Tardiphaga sp.]